MYIFSLWSFITICLMLWYQCFSICQVTDPLVLTGEPDAANSRPVVSVSACHRCLHSHGDSSVIQLQQAASVRHVHFTQQIPGDNEKQRRNLTLNTDVFRVFFQKARLPEFHPNHVGPPLFFCGLELPSVRRSDRLKFH